MCLSLSFCLSALLFLFLSCYTGVLISLSSLSQISAGKVKMIEVRSAETGLQMLRKRDKDIQYLDFLPGVNYQQYWSGRKSLKKHSNI